MRTKQRKDPGMQLIAARPGAFNQTAEAACIGLYGAQVVAPTKAERTEPLFLNLRTSVFANSVTASSSQYLTALSS
jgi:hypothetical protein